jgi:SynChlorMet cassette protein ScmC
MRWTIYCVMSSNIYKRSFVLQLDEQCAWNLTGTRGTETWLTHFAEALVLPDGNREGFPNITFVRGDASGPDGAKPAWSPDLAELKSVADAGWEQSHQGLISFWSAPEGSNVVCEVLNSPYRLLAILSMAQALRPVYVKALSSGGMPVHGALVARGGRGVVIAGPNGAGKTTCCQRLPPPWRVLSDDETLLIDRNGEGYVAHPLPTWSRHFFSQSEHSCDLKQSVSLAAVFFLQHAPCVEVLPLGRARAAGKINESARQASFWRLRPPEPPGKAAWSTALFDNACHIAQAVPAYILRSNLTEPFWEEIERVLEHP